MLGKRGKSSQPWQSETGVEGGVAEVRVGDSAGERFFFSAVGSPLTAYIAGEISVEALCPSNQARSGVFHSELSKAQVYV